MAQRKLAAIMFRDLVVNMAPMGGDEDKAYLFLALSQSHDLRNSKNVSFYRKVRVIVSEAFSST
jgi:hypothetical protein